MENNELKHWGIKGMKWGVRRFQNADGTLTAAGKKRYAEEVKRLKDREQVIKNKERAKAQMAKLEAKRKELDEREKALDNPKPEKVKKVKEEPAPKKRKLRDLSDDELQARIDRLKLEKTYKELVDEINGVSRPNNNNNNNNNKPNDSSKNSVSVGKKFVTHVGKNILLPAVTDASKELIKNAIKGAVNNATQKDGSANQNQNQNQKKKK